MEIKKIAYPTVQIKTGSLYDNADVFVETEDGYCLTLKVCTPQFYIDYMEKEKIDFVPSGSLYIIVNMLSGDIIANTLKLFWKYEIISSNLKLYCEYEGYWLKMYYLLNLKKKVFLGSKLDLLFEKNVCCNRRRIRRNKGKYRRKFEKKMQIKKITYPTELSKVKNQYNDNIDVFVETKEGYKLMFTVCTPQFYTNYMNKEELNFVPLSPPDIIVRKLTHKIIANALNSYCKYNGYWLKIYYLYGEKKGAFSPLNLDFLLKKFAVKKF